jgi:hypothetical protein
MNNSLFNLDEIQTVRSDVLRTPDGQFTTKRNKQQFDKLRTTITMLITRRKYVSSAIRRLSEENLMLKEKLKQYER